MLRDAHITSCNGLCKGLLHGPKELPRIFSQIICENKGIETIAAPCKRSRSKFPALSPLASGLAGLEPRLAGKAYPLYRRGPRDAVRQGPRGGMVTQRTANPSIPVRFRARPPVISIS